MEIQYTTPEKQGVSSRAILRLLRKWKQHQLPMHSMIMARHGKVIAEVYYAPFDKNTLHRMYSETKSFVSLAIGLLMSEGRIRPEDKICDYFPDYLPENPHPWLKEMTIENMLMMETCFDKTVYRKDDDEQNWVKAFFQARPTHRPGTVFQYDTSGTQTLCGLVERLTGMDPLSYLKEKVLNQIGFSEESYLMRRPDGMAMGGSGMMALPMDLMRVGLLLMNEGKDPAHYGEKDAKQLYPEDYLKRALSARTSTIGNSYSEEGYGYQFWMMPEGGFKLFGMGSQDTFCFKNTDLVVVVTADTQAIPNGSDMIYNDIVTEIAETLCEEELAPDPEAFRQLREESCRQGLPVLADRAENNCMKEINGVDFDLLPNEQGFSRMKLVFEEDQKGYLEYEKKDGVKRLRFGRGRLEEDRFPDYNWKTLTCGAWYGPDTFYLRAWVVDEGVSSVHFKFGFLPDGGLTVWMKKTEEVVMNEFQGVLNGQKTER